ncbi:MAG: glutathione S-transferase family protein [Gammaproteobacteria bacterium]|nr:glutathione S-transferase family protein [Gammaproteobacteria bacterium]
MPKLYYTPPSGHSYKVRLLLSFLDIPYESVIIDLSKGEQKTAEYLQINPLGQVPVWQDGSVTIHDSQAILVYLAQQHQNTAWTLPSDAESLAKIVQWLSVAANEITHGPTAIRFYWRKQPSTVNLELATTRAQAILTLINDHLASRLWLELERPTIADIACFPYISLLEDEGWFSLQDYPHVRAWIARFKALPRFIPLSVY